VATTKTGKPSLRVKWTDDMDKDIMPCYYEVTEGDTITIGYRQELHREFTTIYPQFTHLTERRLMDQKRFIINKNKIPLHMLQPMKQEVLDRLAPVDWNTHNETKDEAILTPQNTHNSTLQHPRTNSIATEDPTAENERQDTHKSSTYYTAISLRTAYINIHLGIYNFRTQRSGNI
jgi:hypothetical protein